MPAGQPLADEDRAALSGRMDLVRPYAWTAQGQLAAESFDPFLLLGKRELLGRVRTTLGGILTAHGNASDSSSACRIVQFSKLGIQIGD